MRTFRFKLLTVALILALALSFAGCAQAPSTPAVAPETDVVAEEAMAYFTNMPQDIYKISQDDFIAKVKANEDMFILDIRQPDVYEAGHIKGAVNMPWGAAIAENLSKLPNDKPIMVYCYTGQTAGQTVALLNVAGFDAKTVNLGWNLGISKVDGVADVTETQVNAIEGGASADVLPEIQAAIDEYFSKIGELQGTTYANYKVSEDDAKGLLDADDQSIVFLSIRKAEDFASGHIESSLNIPFGQGMEQSFDQLRKDKKLIVYCYTGQTAGQTVGILRLLGYDAVSLNAGMGMPVTGEAGWANKGFPVVQ